MSLLTLELWRQEMGYHPWHFWGLADTTVFPVTSSCNDVVRQYSWQHADQVGRSDIEEYIKTAEGILANQLGYNVAPAFGEDVQPWPRYMDQRLMRLGRMDVRGGWIPILLKEGYIQDIGIETRTIIQANVLLTYADSDGDGIRENFSFTVPTSVTNINDIAVYFSAADRLPEEPGLADRYRIEPLTLSISAGTLTGRGKSWLTVKPTLYEVASNYPINPATVTNFVTTVDVYHRYAYREGQTAATAQGAIIWESRPPCGWCDDSLFIQGSTDPMSIGAAAARVGVRDSIAGIVVPAEAIYDPIKGYWYHPNDCLSCCGEPDRVQIRYLAGYPPDSKGWIQKSMRTLTARLTAAEMTRRICACDTANREWSSWQFDLARSTGAETYQVGQNVLENPLGTRRGHVYAWQQIKSLARVIGSIA